VAASITATSPDGRTAAQQLLDIRDQVDLLNARALAIFTDSIVPGLRENGIVFSRWDELDDDDRKHLDEVFEERIYPVLTPLAVDPGHPFPYISDLSLNLAVIVRDPRHEGPSLRPGQGAVAAAPVRGHARRRALRGARAGHRAHLDTLFPGMDIEGHFPFRVTRNADLTLEDEDAEDLLIAVEFELRRRRFGRAVRLEVDESMTDEIRELLERELDVDSDDVYQHEGPIDLGGLWSVHGVDRPELRDPVWVPITQSRLASDDDEQVNFFRELRKGDVLVHHPYSSFATSVEEFIRQASVDPKVLAIKMTAVPHLRGQLDHPLADPGGRAGQAGGRPGRAQGPVRRGQQHRVGTRAGEGRRPRGLRARRPQDPHQDHAGRPRGARGHAPLLPRRHRQLQPEDGPLYEDIGLLTCDPEIGSDLTHLFNFLTGYARDVNYKKLLVAPNDLRPRLKELIENEMQAEGDRRLTFKMNSLVDPELIELLYPASQSGVRSI
jgi:polyphosphate kinase